MANDRDIQLVVTDWPSFCKTADMSLDRVLHRDEESLRNWCEERFGPGTLSHEDNGTYLYERGSWAPKFLRKALELLLWKSYR